MWLIHKYIQITLCWKFMFITIISAWRLYWTWNSKSHFRHKVICIFINMHFITLYYHIEHCFVNTKNYIKYLFANLYMHMIIHMCGCLYLYLFNKCVWESQHSNKHALKSETYSNHQWLIPMSTLSISINILSPILSTLLL